jgi:hypothetical protein
MEVRLQPLGDGTILDRETRLVWQQEDSGCELAFPEALSYCSRLRLAGRTDWRLPTTSELSALYEALSRLAGGALDCLLSPFHWSGAWYWTAAETNINFAYDLIVGLGDHTWFHRAVAAARAVRSGAV